MFDRVERIDPRNHWGKEASDFTPWLASPEGISLLSETLGLNITDAATESDVGKFSADIVGKLDGDSERRVVIENQLEATNHDHLGKLITYAAAKDAEVAVWIAPEFEKEHLHAIGWMNERSEGSTKFFAIELSLIKIGSSKPAPHLVVLARPADWKRRGAGGEKPWLKDGRGWHTGPEHSYEANIPTLEKLVDSLTSTPGVRVSWSQKEYVRVLGPLGRELRVWGGQKKDRLDVAFMHADVSTARAALANVPTAPTLREEYVWGGGPWMGLASPADVTTQLSQNLASWLTTK